MSNKERIAENTIIVIKNMFEGNVGQLEDCYGVSSIDDLLAFCQTMKTTYELYGPGTWVPTVPGEGNYYACLENSKSGQKVYDSVWVSFDGIISRRGKDITANFIAWLNVPECPHTLNNKD